MNQLKGTKINRLFQKWPKGTVATSRWLREEGIRFDLLDRYRKTNWVQSIGRAAVIRTNDTVEWTGAVYALQEQLGLSIHPGGKTALALSGKAHFVPMGRERVKLFGLRGERLPAWFLNRDWSCEYRLFPTLLFGTQRDLGMSQMTTGDFSIAVSSAERAMMEMLYCAPRYESLQEAGLIMEGLMTLRPDVVQQLLRHCSSVKVKRLFMVLAERFEYPWFRKLNVAEVDFGSGKRCVVKGGVLHREYSITIPRDWVREATP